MSKKIININLGYQWDGDGLKANAYKAFVQICDSVINQITRSKKINNKNFLITRRRLRGSSGGLMFERIYKMILNSNILIFDTTKRNPNVMLELGMAMAIQKEKNPELNIFLIAEDNADRNSISDLSGYFISKYNVSKSGKITFKDNHSLRSSMVSAISSMIINNELVKIKGAFIDLENI